jgi:hypothetical protein
VPNAAASAAAGNGDVARGAAAVQPSGEAHQPSEAAGPPPQPAEPVGGLSLISSVLWGRVRRNPVPLGFIFGAVAALLLVRRVRGRSG